MARRKNTVEIEESTVAPIEAADSSTTLEKPENEQIPLASEGKDVESVEKRNTESDVKTNIVSEQEIPDNVKDILKVFSNYPELLVTPSGGVFTPGCKLAVSKAAILYKNPFYNA